MLCLQWQQWFLVVVPKELEMKEVTVPGIRCAAARKRLLASMLFSLAGSLMLLMKAEWMLVKLFALMELCLLFEKQKAL